VVHMHHCAVTERKTSINFHFHRELIFALQMQPASATPTDDKNGTLARPPFSVRIAEFKFR
jgi:hypothetical protein